MRVMVMFDLPTETAADRRAYRKFRKGLIRHGFMMLQESIYVKLALNATVQNSVMEAVRRMKPERGNIQMLCHLLRRKWWKRVSMWLLEWKRGARGAWGSGVVGKLDRWSDKYAPRAVCCSALNIVFL